MYQPLLKIWFQTLAGIVLLLASATAVRAELTLPLDDMAKSARLYYMSPTGLGNKDGSSEDNAFAWPQLASIASDFAVASRIVLLPGVYDLTSTIDLRSPTADTVLVLEGRDGALIKGNFDFATNTGTGSGLRLRTGNLILRGLSFQNTGFCVKSEKASVVNQVLIENLTAKNVHTCILVDRDSTQPVTRWIVRDSRIQGYYRAAIRLAGAQSSDFLLDKLQIDGAHDQAKSDCFKSGIQLYAGVNQVHIRDSSVSNNIGSCGEAYQQGDGIEADHKEGTPDQILLENIEVANSGDADLDLKADHVTLTKVVTHGGPLTRYAFKVWTYDNYQCDQCYAYGLNKAYINLNQATMRFTGSTFANDKPVHICDLRHGTTPEQQAVVQFVDTSIYIGNDEWLNECGPGVLAGVKRLPPGKLAPPEPATNLRGR